MFFLLRSPFVSIDKPREEYYEFCVSRPMLEPHMNIAVATARRGGYGL